ncbi:sensor histidine kinase [Paenibacillus rigui]|uniref:Histidine kinase n=1 Tax=Paenibacillus rigui TaxID=554312 RepID=A0A229URV4_9BACL|nr:sensor histidine kinase [Paenibacillus rigui]OXM85649.1 hypothetical protein CF651_14800 [Paenibacillus rigui]
MMERSYRNLEIELTKMESLYALFQNNVKLTEYLSGLYANDLEMAYNYKKEISPTFTYAYIGNQLLDKITVYKNNPEVPIVSAEIEDIDHYADPGHEDDVKKLPPSKGMWTFEPGTAVTKLPTIRYIHKMYNDSFTRELGLFQLTLNDGLIKQFFQTLQSKGDVWHIVLDDNKRVIFQDTEPILNDTDLELIFAAVPDSGVKTFYMKKHSYLVNAAKIKHWNLVMLEISPTDEALNIRKEIGWSVAVGLLLLLLLSALYFMMASSFAMRIIRFSRHMKRVVDPRHAYYPDTSESDEIGFLITNYNAMMHRVEELTHAVTQTEQLKQEAEIKMLQAQIKPHFLYNTLETMRMLALMKGDDEVADIGLKLGKLLRYSLSKTKDETTLFEELEHVQDYVDIHLSRMGERLEMVMNVHGAHAMELRCPRFILQPLVENSLLHGIEKIRGKGKISLDLWDHAHEVVIRLSDNGAGMDEQRLTIIQDVLAGKLPQEQIPFSGGIGLYNVNERIKAFFGGHSGMMITSHEGQGTVIEIKLVKRRGEQSA